MGMILKIKKWGNSAGIFIPKKKLAMNELTIGSTVKVEKVKQTHTLDELRGIIPKTALSAQKFKEEIREEEYETEIVS